MQGTEYMQEMQDLPSFFIDQRLEQSADERTIKRAYAKALKQIDQENDLTGFQDLRESYEYALSWARHRDWLASQESESHDLPVVVAPEAPLSDTKADDAPIVDETSPSINQDVPSGHIVSSPILQGSAEQTNGSAPALMSLSLEEPEQEFKDEHTQSQSLMSLDGETAATENSSELAITNAAHIDKAATKVAVEDLPQLSAPIDVAKQVMEEVLQKIQTLNDENADLVPLLRQALDDDRLINVEAADLFEWLMANHVAQGWQPGNGNLFGATVKSFKWNEDKSRLLRFGELGYYLEHALVEMSLFNQQERGLADRQVQLIRRARAATLPDKHFLREHIQFIHHMTSSFPNWLNLVTSWTNLQAWRERADELKIVPEAAKAVNTKPEKEPSSFSQYGGIWFFVIFVLLSIVRGCGNEKTHSPSVQSSPFSQSVGGKTEKPKETNADRLFLAGEDAYFGRDNKVQSFKNAESAWLAAAQTDHLDAIAHLADLYADPKTGLENPELAHQYRLKAAERGKTRMYFGVANDFLMGRGVKKDEKLAFEWTQKAVDSGEKQALNNLGYLYERGSGVKKDPLKALEYYERGAVAGEPVALRNAGMSYLTGQLGGIKDLEKGYAYLKKSADKSYVRAQYDLGLIAEKALYKQPKDLELAVQWYERAIKQGNEDAKKRLQAMCKLKQYTACSQVKPV